MITSSVRTGMATIFGSLPVVLVTVFLAACVLWLIWQALRRLVSPRKGRLGPSLSDDRGDSRIEPAAPGLQPRYRVFQMQPTSWRSKQLSATWRGRSLPWRNALQPAKLTSLPRLCRVTELSSRAPAIPFVSPDHRIECRASLARSPVVSGAETGGLFSQRSSDLPECQKISLIDPEQKFL
jgi:hypothetical protein